MAAENFARQKNEPNCANIVHAVDNYDGIFRDKNGKCHDFRPHNATGINDYIAAKLRGESVDNLVFKPTLANFRKLETPVLRKLLLLAYREQLRVLKSDAHKPYDVLYEVELKKSITRRIEQLSGV